MVRCEVQGAGVEASGADGEQGFMLLGLIVMMAIILLMLGVAASKAAFSLRRDKELESARRADQYFRAIRLFSMKNGHYPGSVEQLENTNNVRYLRQKYVDPLTGTDYRLIVVGQNKTTVKGFFGQPLGAIGAPGPGAVGGPQGQGGATLVKGVNGATGTTGSTGDTGATGAGANGGGAGGSGTATDGSSSTTSPIGSPQGGSGLAAAAGPIMGVGSSASGPSILTVNGETSYEKWEFLYDPRLEQLGVVTALNGTMSPGSSANDNSPQSSQH
jgi:type II secretory pathway pseudopilin PulG